jgi:hypothetical protein
MHLDEFISPKPSARFSAKTDFPDLAPPSTKI